MSITDLFDGFGSKVTPVDGRHGGTSTRETGKPRIGAKVGCKFEPQPCRPEYVIYRIREDMLTS